MFMVAVVGGDYVLVSPQTMVLKSKVGAARCVGFSHDGELVAVGLKNGGFLVLHTATLKVWGQKRDRSKMITDVR